jgi:hypothetical protein
VLKQKYRESYKTGLWICAYQQLLLLLLLLSMT